MGLGSLLTIALLVGTSISGSVQGAKILSIFGYPGPSQYIFISPLLKALAERGHEVTSISTFPQKEPLKNFRDIAVMENIHLFDDLMTEAAEGTQKFFFEEFIEIGGYGKSVVANTLENSAVKNMLKNDHFDLIIVEVLATEALLGLGEFFNAPVVAVSTLGTMNFLDYLVGNPSPLSYIPHMAMPYDNHMSLRHRIANVLMQAVHDVCINFFILPQQDKLYKSYFPTATRSLDEARKNVSLVLLNDHFSLGATRPYVPNMIEVGGLHIKQQPDPLPQDLQTFLDGATEGAIYFSMGSNIKSKDLPAETLKVILDTFRELKIKVLWKFEAEDLPNKPDNVLIRKWFPQPSVLAHPNVKLFISHGGYLSTTETIFHGKPILGLPMLGDQFMNVRNAVKAGYALTLQLAEITTESFKDTILELWTNPRYSQAVQRLSKRYRDQPLTPLETAIYWTEYVLRHEGAPHMRNAGQDLSFMEYHNIDVYVILMGGLAVIVAILIGFVLLIKKMCYRVINVSRKHKKRKIKRN